MTKHGRCQVVGDCCPLAMPPFFPVLPNAKVLLGALASCRPVFRVVLSPRSLVEC